MDRCARLSERREKHDTIINFVDKERLDQLSETKKHQGVIAVAAYEYAEVEDILKNAEEKGNHRSFLFWIILRIRITSVRSSVPQIWQERMA